MNNVCNGCSVGQLQNSDPSCAYDLLQAFGAVVMFAGMDSNELREEQLHATLERSRIRFRRGGLAMSAIELCVAFACGVGLLFNSTRGGSGTTGLLLTAVGVAALIDLRRRATATDT